MEIRTKSANFFVFDQFIVAEPKEYIDVYKAEVEQLHELVLKSFKGNFGLIENRINETSINPLAYIYAKELMPNLSAFALVVYSDMARKAFESESMFIEGIKYELFFSLDEAKAWMKSVLL